MRKTIYLVTVYDRKTGWKYVETHFDTMRAAKVWAEDLSTEDFRCAMTKYTRAPFVSALKESTDNGG